MKSQPQLSGMRAVYLAASELSKLGFIVCTTSRNAQGADLLVTDQECMKTFSVQVKSDQSSRGYFFTGEKGKYRISETYIYVLVDIIKPSKKNPTEKIEYYIVPSKIISDKIEYGKSKSGKAEFWGVYTKDISEYKDKWEDSFGKAEQDS